MSSLGSAVVSTFSPARIPLVTDLTPGAGFRMDTGIAVVQTLGATTTTPTVPTSGITWPPQSRR